MMKAMYWLVGILVSVPVLYMGAIYGASEFGGEVVTLDRSDPNGEVSEVRIWIVDDNGMSWVEHGEAESFWISHLPESPKVMLSREGQTENYVGTPDPGSHDRYHKLRQKKYGWADQVVAGLTVDASECQGVPVRLQFENQTLDVF
jgi:hypothetical protein